MKKIFLTFMLSISFAASAEDFENLKHKIVEARQSLLILVQNKTQRGIDQQKIVKQTINDVSKALHEVQAPMGQEKKLDELKDLWRAFKTTRENEIVPAVLDNKEEVAEKLAMGVQKVRLEKMISILEDLRQKSSQNLQSHTDSKKHK